MLRFLKNIQINNYWSLRKKHKLLIVGQTPPPYGGQAIMIENILKFRYDDIQLIHVRMNFSSGMDDIGKVKLKKFFELFRVIVKIYWQRIFHNVNVLYYPPAGPNTVPILRDIVILLTTRFLFRKTIFHFHAAGLSEKFHQLQPVLQLAFKKAYFYPDLTIRLSKLNPDDGNFLRTKKDLSIPYGIDSITIRPGPYKQIRDNKINILYAGVLKESKGLFILLKAVHLIVNRGYTNISLLLMGEFESKSFEQEIKSMIAEKGLKKYIHFLGVKTGVEKFSCFEKCDIFCFPSYFESETFGVVLLEAMQFAKPVVATNWRGIPDIVTDHVTGFLVEPKDAVMLAESLIKLIKDKDLRIRLGKNGLRHFEERFTKERFMQNFYNAIKECWSEL